MASPLCTTWPDVQTHILDVLATLRIPRKPVCPASSSGDAVEKDDGGNCLSEFSTYVETKTKAKVHLDAHSNPDAVLNTLLYLFYHQRCGIFVAIREGTVKLFVPFANEAYRNRWHRQLQIPRDYLRDKARAHHRSSTEEWIPPDQWWLNGGVVCNVLPPKPAPIWGDSHNADILDMLETTCRAFPVPDCDFFVNKRDYPQLKADGTEPCARFLHDMSKFASVPLCREAYRDYAAIASFYVGEEFADIPMPLTEDWKLVRHDETPPWVASMDATWETAAPLAIFRGSATGTGTSPATNPRIHLAEWARSNRDILDFGLTSVGYRDRLTVLGGAESGKVSVSFVHPAHLPRTVPFQSLEAQAAKCKYFLYVDGHSASNRYGALMWSGRPILRVTSCQTQDCGTLWLFPGLLGARVDGTEAPVIIPEGVDHFIVDTDLGNLRATVEFLKGHNDIARQVGANARGKAPTRQLILRAWMKVLSAAAAIGPGISTDGGDDDKDDTKHDCMDAYCPYTPSHGIFARIDGSDRFVACNRGSTKKC